MKIKSTTAAAALGLVLGMMATTTARAQISISTVVIGNPGNSADSTTYGGVSYVYAIGAHEVNLSQYTAFLNAVAATDTYDLYNTSMATNLNSAGIARSGSAGSYTYSVIGSGSRPVTFVNWFDAARFSNWMANGQPTGAQAAGTTEDGAYTLNGATTGVGFTKNAINPNTSAATTWWIPSEDEWYKAAYFDPTKGGSGGYWLYPTQSDSAPGNEIGASANQANYFVGDYATTPGNGTNNPSQNYLTDGGAFSGSDSFYGTFDQAGNVWEWLDAVSGTNRVRRGGSWATDVDLILQSSNRTTGSATVQNSSVGFRLATVPEPSTYALLALGAGALCLAKRRRNRIH